MHPAAKQRRSPGRLGSVLSGLGLPIVVLALAGCGGSSSSSSASSQGSSGATSSSKPVKLALVELLTANSFYQTLATGATDAAHSTPGVSLVVTGPSAPNPTTEIGDISQVLSQGLDGMIVDPAAASLFVKILGQAASQTRLMTIDNPAVLGTHGSETNLGINEFAASRALLDAVIPRLPANPSGTIVLGSCIPGIPALDDRTNAYKAYIAQKLPNVKVVGAFATTTDPTGNLSNWQRIYASNPGALAYIGNCDSDGPSLARLHALHPGNYLTATFDIDTTTLQGIKNGTVTAAINEAPYVRGYVATALMIDAARSGKPLPKGFVNIKAEVVTKSNVDAVIARENSPKAGYAAKIQAFLKSPTTATGPIAIEPISGAYSK